MTIGDVLAADVVVDLTSRYPLGERDGAAGRWEAELVAGIGVLLESRDEAAADNASWACWVGVATAVRMLARHPPGWWTRPRLPVAKAIHTVGVYRWAPPVARRIAPGGPLPYVKVARLQHRDYAREKSVLRVFRFWAEEVKPGYPAGSFLRPDEVTVEFAPGLEKLVCRECNRLMPLTPAGRFSKRARCEKCQAVKEHAAWKTRNPEKARELWKKATDKYRSRLRGEDG